MKQPVTTCPWCKSRVSGKVGKGKGKEDKIREENKPCGETGSHVFLPQRQSFGPLLLPRAFKELRYHPIGFWATQIFFVLSSHRYLGHAKICQKRSWSNSFTKSLAQHVLAAACWTGTSTNHHQFKKMVCSW